MSWLRETFFAFEFWWMILRRPADQQRASFVHENFTEIINSGLRLMVGSALFGAIALTLLTVAPWLLVIWVLSFGFFALHAFFILFMVNSENNRYYSFDNQSFEARRSKVDKGYEEAMRRWEKMSEEFKADINRRASETEQRNRTAQETWEEVLRNHYKQKEQERQQQAGGNPKWEEKRKQQYQQQRQAPPPPRQAPKPIGIEVYLLTLGLPITCRDFATVKKAYRALIKKHHPDVNKSVDSVDKSKKIIHAYEQLGRMLK